MQNETQIPKIIGYWLFGVAVILNSKLLLMTAAFKSTFQSLKP